ncbi:MAG: hypothetical protein KZQ73_01635 [Candidatus Thiodiazotropha sp. (ex Semelilucina semeliformis)]|nr:hypothetical protein [Candidatus Thiodiazotropha sp. (ex Semelilucina semeliformis)]
MLKKMIFGLIVAATAVGSSVSANEGGKKSCMTIGGIGMGNFLPQTDGTTKIVALLTGSFAVASGVIFAQRETATGLEMDLEHHFVAADGGYMHTKDMAILSKVAGKMDQYMIEITYDIQEATTAGSFEGYKGSFRSFGAVDLAGNKGLVRYSGNICS